MMPSLFKYFACMGSVLLGLLLGVNYMVAPPPAESRAAQTAAPIAVQHEPGASKIERWRDDQAALKAVQEGKPIPTAVTKPQPAMAVATASLATPQPAAEPAASAKPEPAQPAKVKSAHAPKKPVARDRARPAEIASRRQDQLYYSQRFTAFAPRPVFGPFGEGRLW